MGETVRYRISFAGKPGALINLAYTVKIIKQRHGTLTFNSPLITNAVQETKNELFLLTLNIIRFMFYRTKKVA